jgi:hypothetical protein
MIKKAYYYDDEGNLVVFNLPDNFVIVEISREEKAEYVEKRIKKLEENIRLLEISAKNVESLEKRLEFDV